MLRVYSIIYIEKLWNTNPSPILKDVASSHHSSTSSLQVAECSREIVQLEQEEEEEEEEEEEQDIRSQFATYIMETATTETTSILNSSSDVDDEEEESRKDSKLSVQALPEQNEQTVKDLGIKIEEEQVKKEYVESPKEYQSSTFKSELELEDEEEAAVATSLSSTSSIVPPSTPPSIITSTNYEKYSSPRTTSLLRRETTKLNDRRKSLTQKLKRALTVKSSATNKRNSL
ncbi:hypothetical protein EDC94DRAFT_625235 [Helicostylum pulchrum]|nr:hypothetical protein EDC94DRAFT_625235 [Helicostylum pulchrum]